MKQIHNDGDFVYVLRCANGYFYCGYARNVSKRFFQHAIRKGAKFTRSHFPLELVYYEKCASKEEALQKEYQLKQLSHLKKAMLVNDFLHGKYNADEM